MFKNRKLLVILLSVILLIFSINVHAYYKYTQESGANFYVGTGDKADALEDTNQVRQILDDLGNLLGHSKRDDLYPKNGTTGGYLGRLNYGLDTSKPAVPVVNDMYLATDTTKVYKCFVAGNWIQIYPLTIENNVIKTGTFTAGKIAKINNASGIIEMATNTDAQVSDAVTKAHAKNADTDLESTFEATFVKKADTVNVLSDITSPGANIEDAVTKRHAKNTDTDLDATFEATFVKKADTVNVLSDITSPGASIEDAVTKKHTSGSETLAGDVSGTVGANTVNKIKGHTVDETAIANDKILVYKTTGDKFVYETQTGGVDTSGTPEANDIARFTDADTIEGINYIELKTALALSSDDLSDVASIAMLDEAETVTGLWTFDGLLTVNTEDGSTSKAIFTPCAAEGYGFIIGPYGMDVVSVDENGDFSGWMGDMYMNYWSGGCVYLASGGGKVYVGGDMTAVGGASIEATDLDYTNTLASDHTYSGEIDSQPVGESVVFGDLLYFNWTDKEWKKTDADAAATMPGLRIALETKADGETCLMLVKGYIRDDSAFEFTASMIYTSVIPGAMSSTAPTETGDQVQRVGVGKSADILFFDPSIDVGEI